MVGEALADSSFGSYPEMASSRLAPKQQKAGLAPGAFLPHSSFPPTAHTPLSQVAIWDAVHQSAMLDNWHTTGQQAARPDAFCGSSPMLVLCSPHLPDPHAQMGTNVPGALMCLSTPSREIYTKQHPHRLLSRASIFLR